MKRIAGVPCWAICVAFVLSACTSGTPVVENADTHPTAPSAEKRGAEPHSLGASSGDAPTTPTSAPTLTKTSPPPFEGIQFERVLDAQVRSIALGHDSRVAVLADVPRVFDGKAWVERPVPDTMHPPSPTDRVNIFFGRDNQPRLMGTRIDANGAAATTYLRLKQGRWKEEPSELGPLASARDGLYGVLGFADPEVVCAPKGLCLIKTLKGWTRTAADSAGNRFYLTPNGVYATRGREWQLLEGDQFRSLGELPFQPIGLCHHDADRVWAVSSESLWLAAEQKASTFEKQELTAQFRDVQCDARHVWAVGVAGAFVQSDGTWYRVPDLTDLSVVAIGDHQVWLGGPSGLFWGQIH